MLIRGGAFTPCPSAHTPAESMRARTRLELPTGGAQCVPSHVLAKLWKVPRSRITALVEEGELVAFDLRAKGSSRSCVRVTRASLISFMEARQDSRSRQFEALSIRRQCQ
jgi:hypothetical protein